VSLVCALPGVIAQRAPGKGAGDWRALPASALDSHSRTCPAFPPLPRSSAAIPLLDDIFALGVFGEFDTCRFAQRVWRPRYHHSDQHWRLGSCAALFSEGGLTRSAIFWRGRARLQDAWKSEELADRAKSGFLPAASHDLRQPLQTLKTHEGRFGPHHPDS